MAEVKRQITDSVTQTDELVVGGASAQSFAMLYQVMASAFGGAMQNATTAQQAMRQVGMAAVANSCARILASAEPAPHKPCTKKPCGKPVPHKHSTRSAGEPSTQTAQPVEDLATHVEPDPVKKGGSNNDEQ